jgi:hypothetical protein
VPNALATTLIAFGIVATAVGLVLGTADSGDLGLLFFALLIALNCQDWEGGMK